MTAAHRCRLLVLIALTIGALPAAAAAARSLPLDRGAWRLWCDTEAEWEHDRLYLPGEFKLAELPVNPPTIGWEPMYRSGIEVSLPSTVEEHFWGELGERDYADYEYYFAKRDSQVKNGSYRGVSWWWSRFRAPGDIGDELAFLEFDGVRQRAEVFLNEQLVGYDLIAETPFAIDVTGKLKPGAENVLAVRITSPGGRLDWPDFIHVGWGDYGVPGGHAFGGINGGVRLELKPRAYVDSVFVMNQRDPRRVTVRCELVNATDRALPGRLEVAIAGTEAIQSRELTLAPGATSLEIELRVAGARLWTVDSPQLYVCRTTLRCDDRTDTDETTFGFRYLDVRGIGDDARLYWNGRRIVLRSAISWGFWGINGLWPDAAMAEREIVNAKRIGLNCINFHRCMGRPLTLDMQDRLGLLRYEEPGGGGSVLSGHEFAANYMEQKVLRMVKRDRNHPCLALYCLQNEWNPDLNNPRLERILREMHELDPTRPVVAKSGIEVKSQAFLLPYDDHLYKDDGTNYSGWWDRHTVGGPGIYVDGLYGGPDNWSHRSDNRREIVFWGEMLGVGTPDNLQVVHDYYRRTGRTGYDRRDNAEQYAAFDRFLDERGFRSAFPTVGALTRSIGDKAYYFWGRMIENIRISDCNDAMVLSGWESTSIENHSGVLDSHRYLKGDPQLTSYYCRPLHLAIKSRRLVIETGESLTTDLHIVNEVDAQGEAEVDFRVIDPQGRVVERRTVPVKLSGGDVFGELLAEAIETDCYSRPGYYLLRADLRQRGRSLVDGRERIFVVDCTPPAIEAKGAVRDQGGRVKTFLAERGMDLPDYSDDPGKLDYVIVAGDNEAGLTDELARRAREDGTALIFWTTGPDQAEGLAKAMEERGLLKYGGRVGKSWAPWMGNWTAVRKHPLLKGLPIGTALDWEYQTNGIDGLTVDGEGVEWIAAYGKDHSRTIGTTLFTAPCGEGRIIVNCIADVYGALTGNDRQPASPVTRRMLFNAIEYATSE